MKITFLLLLFALIPAIPPCLAGTVGILEGTVRDGKSGEPLPGTTVFIVEIQRGTATDAEGRYQLNNVRAGTYTVRCTHVGYTPSVFREVAINPDLRTTLAVQLRAEEVRMGEIVVTQETPLIQHDATGTVHIVSGKELTLLPIQGVNDVLGLQAGTTIEGNVRGGKTSEVTYLIDGLPVQDQIAGGVATMLPRSSVYGMSLYTGGFEPEYGNALSGVVNIITRVGGDDQTFSLRADNDDLLGLTRMTQTSKTTDVELSAGGPVEKSKLYYTASARGVLSGTRWWQDFGYFFSSPVEQQWNGFGKLDYLISPVLRVGGQVLFDLHDWHDYEFPWRYNLAGLPAERKTSNRIAAILSHTPTDNFSYTASLSRYFVGTTIGKESQDAVPVRDSWEYDFFLRYIVAGSRALWERARQESYTGKFDGTLSAGKEHLVKFGAEGTLYRVTSDVVHFEPQLTYFGKPLAGTPPVDYSSSYRYFPRSGALYIQDKIDILDRGGLVNIGLRYDFLDARATRPPVGLAPADSLSGASSAAVKGGLKQTLSPRFAVMMQLDEKSYLFVNLGWYVQYPLFDYLYSGLDRVGLTQGVSAITGNPGLEPERTQSWEISYKRVIGSNVVVSATYFKKTTTNLIDTKTFVPGDSKISGSYGFAQYVNAPHADASGFELTVARDRGDWVTGEISYTYMTAEGTSSSATQGFVAAQYGLPSSPEVYPLSWDQRHALTAVVSVTTPEKWNAHIVVHARSGRPYTYYPTSTGFEQINSGLFAVNNQRMPGYASVDLVLERQWAVEWWENGMLSLYCDIRNLTNAANVAWMDSNGRIGGELSDPSGYFIGRRTRLGVRANF